MQLEWSSPWTEANIPALKTAIPITNTSTGLAFLLVVALT